MNKTDKLLMGLGASMAKGITEAFNRAARCSDVCNQSIVMYWRNRRKVLERNNRRKINGKSTIRIKAYDKAFKNRRKNYGSSTRK